MIVYIESNFVLELALQQEQSSYALQILDLAEQKKITLILPDFALIEPFATVMHRNGERLKVSNNLLDTFKEIGRSKSQGQITKHAESVKKLIREVEKQEWDSLHEVVGQLLKIGASLRFDHECLKQATIYCKQYDLSSQDAVIYAGIIADLQKRSRDEEKCFLSRDRRAFGREDDYSIKAELNTYNCRYIGSFRQGLDYIQNILPSVE